MSLCRIQPTITCLQQRSQEGASIIRDLEPQAFSESETAKYNVAVRDRDGYLTALCGEATETVAAVVDAARANLRLSEPTAEEYLQALENQGLKSFVTLIRATSSGDR